MVKKCPMLQNNKKCIAYVTVLETIPKSHERQRQLRRL